MMTRLKATLEHVRRDDLETFSKEVCIIQKVSAVANDTYQTIDDLCKLGHAETIFDEISKLVE
jgi:hypothetical protein